jgi:hypothetical protein
VLNLVFYIRGEHIFGEFGDRVLRMEFEPKGEEVTGDWKNFIVRSFMICTLHQKNMNSRRRMR